jgi:hypothetical protein
MATLNTGLLPDGAGRSLAPAEVAPKSNSKCLFPFGRPEGERMSLKNRQVLLASGPSGEPTPENFRLVEAEAPGLAPARCSFAPSTCRWTPTCAGA